MSADEFLPKVTVIMVARNAQSTIGQALASLLAQTLSDWECIVIDDASSDGTSAILSGLDDDRFRVVSLSVRLGRGGARNEALELARGEYLASLDADDFLYPDALSKLSQALDDDPSLGACTGSLILMSEKCLPFGRLRTQLLPGEYVLQSPLATRLPLGSIMIRTSLVGDNRFDSSFRRTEDRDFFDRVLCGQRVLVLGEQTYAYRWSLEFESVMEGLKNREALFQRHSSERPLEVATQIALTRIKLLLYPCLAKLGVWELLNRWRAVPSNQEERERFEQALETVRKQAI